MMATSQPFTLTDISVVIPTYNRPQDLSLTLEHLAPLSKNLREIIVVDQSDGDQTKKIVRASKIKNIKYVYSSTPSITIARNIGVQRSSKKSKIISFIDDDVSVHKNYFSQILSVFNAHAEARAVAGYDVSNKSVGTFYFFERLLRQLFFLSRLEKEKARIVSSYGNTYPFGLSKIINVEWLPGTNMAYRKEIFREQQFDEHLLGYTVAEDIDFTYRLYKKYPQALFITPFATFDHRASKQERYPVEKLSYVNQIDHFYFYFKNFKGSLLRTTIFLWSLLGIFLLRTLKFVFGFRKVDYFKLKFFITSLFYCILHLGAIKQGNLRNFL